ncbi:hypothetical protein PMM47T1_01305 [Pseudomonas sp. M47T1]|uniref:hypothetical protein n=1 Tax=unclassified Pseudomonas TaxID=196821 RepID=UPI0002607F62|nr:hypothetical protein [Pseudomonas sp. M47T1]EIK98633.1 hypothetical protein PMM47T1_01305 [Pseudomonas sp. M47T1]
MLSIDPDAIRAKLKIAVAALKPHVARFEKSKAALPNLTSRDGALIADQALIQVEAGVQNNHLDAFSQFCRLAQLRIQTQHLNPLSDEARAVWIHAFLDFGWSLQGRGSAPRFRVPNPTIPTVTSCLARQLKFAQMVPLIERSMKGQAGSPKASELLKRASSTQLEVFSFQSVPVFRSHDDRLCVGLFFTHYTAQMLHGNGRPPAEWRRDFDNFGTACTVAIDLESLERVLPVIREETQTLGRLLFEEIRI